MNEEPYATRREVDALIARLDRLDANGTRGVLAVQQQLTDLVKDVTEIKVDFDKRFETHLRQHDTERQDRISGRRWLITTGIGGLAAMGGLYGLMIAILQHMH